MKPPQSLGPSAYPAGRDEGLGNLDADPTGNTFTPRRRSRSRWSVYGYLVPATVLLVGVFAIPLVQSLVLSLQKSAGLAGTSGWAGTSNYADVFASSLFWIVLIQTLLWTVGVVLITTLISFVLASLLQPRFRGRTAVRLALMFPWASSIALSAVVWKFGLKPDGLVDRTLSVLGLQQFILPWLANTPQVELVLIGVGVWVSVPFTTVMLSAGMQSIPREIYEAASLESRRAWDRTWFITLPLVRQMLAIVTLGNFVVVFNSFPIIYIMTGGGPVNKTDIFATYIYSKAFSELDFGHASALAVVVSVLLLSVSLVYVRLVVNRARH